MQHKPNWMRHQDIAQQLRTKLPDPEMALSLQLEKTYQYNLRLRLLLDRAHEYTFRANPELYKQIDDALNRK